MARVQEAVRASMSAAIETVGVIRAGQMGTGIALVCAQAGMGVRLHDIDPERVKSSLATINGLLARQVAKGQLDEDGRKAVLERIESAPQLDSFADRDIVIEAATEVEEVKRKIFIGLKNFIRKDAVIASNTSSISITRL